MPEDQYIKLPDGSMGKFRGDMPDSQIRQIIARDFPKAYDAPKMGGASGSWDTPKPVPSKYPAVDQAIESITNQDKDAFGHSKAIQFTGGELALQGLESAGAKEPNRFARGVYDIIGLSGVSRAIRGGYNLAEAKSRQEEYKAGSDILSGGMKASTPLIAVGMAAKPVLAAGALIGGEFGSRGSSYATKKVGGTPAAQEFAGNLGGLIGAGIGGGITEFRGRYLEAVERTKQEYRAQRPATSGGLGGSSYTVDENQLQKFAETKVQNDIAKGGTFPELTKQARDFVIHAAKSGAFATTEPKPEEQTGVNAKLTLSSSPKKGSVPEAVTRPVTPVEQVKNLIKTTEETKPSVREQVKAVAKPKPQEVVAPGTVESRPPSTPELFVKRMQQLKGQGLSDPEQAFQLAREFPEHADEIANAFKRTAKTTPDTSVGRETTSSETSKPETKPLPTSSSSKGPGEPVRSAERSKVGDEPRSLRGDLGERQPQTPKVKPLGLPDKAVFDQRVKDMLKRNPYMAEKTAQRVVSEQIVKERGSLNLGGPEDEPSVRRERKINDWINQLRDLNAPLDQQMRAMKNLGSFGLSHDEIIRRVGEAQGFAKTGADESLNERLAPDKEADEAADRIMGEYNPNQSVDEIIRDTAMHVEGRAVGSPDIKTVKTPLEEELDNIYKLQDPRKAEREDERGSFSLRRIKKAQTTPTGAPVIQSSLADLTTKIESALKATPPNDSRMRIAERLDTAVTEGWDKTRLSVGRMAAQAVALKDMYLHGPEVSDYHTALGRFSGSLNRSAWELRQFTRNIKEKLPDPRRREAITNWIQAAGDDKVLADRAARSKGAVRAGYEAARTLTGEEKNLATFITDHFDTRLKEAIKMDILKEGLENYVPQIWKPKDQGATNTFFSTLHRSGLLKTDFNSARHRIFDSYFEGEQAGRKPVSKDIGFLVASWDKALNQTIASRTFVRELSTGLAKDGRPVIAPSGAGKAIHETSVDPASAYLIHPKAGPDETGDYVALNHPALTKWTWTAKDDNGAPIFLKGDLRVHPDHAAKLDNIINRGKWAAAHPIQTKILEGQAFFKQTLLAASPFHQIQEGTHALFHKVNPFNPGQIDLTNPSMGKLLDHGLVIGNHDPVAAFEEGVSAGGAVGKIPGFGRFMQKYTDYLFQDYIPRLKAKMATEAYDRNLDRYSKPIAEGKITVDQVAELTANQANAAFGELNYMMMGRHPQTQAMLRMMFLAPDFLEARARFVAQALHPKWGLEQYAALFRGAAGMYVTARIVNQVLDDDPHWDKPFSLVAKGYEYKIRTLPGDVWHLLEDHNSFVNSRLNPVTVKTTMEAVSGKDDFGRKRALGQQIMDFVQRIIPIPGQKTAEDIRRGDNSLWRSLKTNAPEGIAGAFGVTREKYRTQAGALAHQYALEGAQGDVTSHHVSELVQDMENGTLDSDKVARLLQQGKMNMSDFTEARTLARIPELYRDYHKLSNEQKAKVLVKATPAERALIRRYSSRELDRSKLLPAQRAEFMQEYANQ